jgi:hypothetical protein
MSSVNLTSITAESVRAQMNCPVCGITLPCDCAKLAHEFEEASHYTKAVPTLTIITILGPMKTTTLLRVGSKDNELQLREVRAELGRRQGTEKEALAG